MYEIKNVAFPSYLFHGKNKDDFFVHEVQDNLCNPRFFPGDVVLIERVNELEKGMEYAVVLIGGFPQLVKLDYDEEHKEYIFAYKPAQAADFCHETHSKKPCVIGAVRYLIRKFEKESAGEVENDTE
ncbi:MAG: hypothetical protein IJE10_04920 [Clostridia bacterium]|nr:hypothetical protein [Clostridia bacterium]